MSLNRRLKREQLKKEWKKFKKENREFKNMPFARFRTLWEESIVAASKQEVSEAITEEQEAQLADMFVEEIDEDPVTE